MTTSTYLISLKYCKSNQRRRNNALLWRVLVRIFMRRWSTLKLYRPNLRTSQMVALSHKLNFDLINIILKKIIVLLIYYFCVGVFDLILHIVSFYQCIKLCSSLFLFVPIPYCPIHPNQICVSYWFWDLLMDLLMGLPMDSTSAFTSVRTNKSLCSIECDSHHHSYEHCHRSIYGLEPNVH